MILYRTLEDRLNELKKTAWNQGAAVAGKRPQRLVEDLERDLQRQIGELVEFYQLAKEPMRIRIRDGMRFIHRSNPKDPAFVVHKRDYYEDGRPEWCAVWDEDHFYPLHLMQLAHYSPLVEDHWVAGDIEYDF